MVSTTTTDDFALPTSVLLIPAIADPLAARAPRMPAALGWMLAQLRAFACRATVGLTISSLDRWPDLAEAVIDSGCETALMPDDETWKTMPSGALRDMVEAMRAEFIAHDLPTPTTFLPPRPGNEILTRAQTAALAEAGIVRVAGLRSEDLSSALLGEVAGVPLNGAAMRLLPVWVIRTALAPGRADGCAISPTDIDPGAPGFLPGRSWLMRKFPALLKGGFVAAREAYR